MKLRPYMIHIIWIMFALWLAGCIDANANNSSTSATSYPPDTPFSTSVLLNTQTATDAPIAMPITVTATVVPLTLTPTPAPTVLPTLEPHPETIQRLEVNQIGGEATALVVEGDTAYLLIGPRLVVLDISDRSQPHEIGKSDWLPFIPDDLAIVAGFAYLFGANGTLTIFDLGNPSHPQIDSQTTLFKPLESSTNPFRIVQQGPFLFVVQKNGTFREPSTFYIMDISDPVRPQVVSTLEFPMAVYGVTLVEEYIYLFYHESIQIFDISNPKQPVLVNAIPQNGEFSGGVIAGENLVTSGTVVALFNITDPTMPQRVMDLYEFVMAEQNVIGIQGDYFYVTQALGDAGWVMTELSLMNLKNSNEYGPSAIISVLEASRARGQIEGNYLYVLFTNRFLIFDITISSQPSKLSQTDIIGWVANIAASEQYLFVRSGGSGNTQIFDRSLPDSPTYINTVEGVEGYVLLGSHQDYAYGVMLEYFVSFIHPFIDQTYFIYPEDVFRTDFNLLAKQWLVTSGNYAYAFNERELVVINISNLSQPAPVAYLDHQHEGRWSSFYLAEPYLYLVSSFEESGITIVDIHNPEAPQEIAYIPSTGVNFVKGNLLYSGGSPFSIFDISQPSQPQPIRRIEMNIGWSAAVVDNYVYGISGNTVLVTDLTDPLNPQIFAQITLPDDFILDVTQIGSYIYIANRKGGLFVLHAIG